jgi:hypothetical protein
MPCAPNRIAPPMVPMTGHLYRGYGLRQGGVGRDEEERQTRAREIHSTAVRFAPPHTTHLSNIPAAGITGARKMGQRLV